MCIIHWKCKNGKFKDGLTPEGETYVFAEVRGMSDLEAAAF
ncbi:hypothetical protein J2Z83_002921 [Virgibacillus natechei]|uniref:Uncharacterized protein n=1 Tax=Virgibacillus natechei TaxID=1216297 RepID=A0ABS4IIN7_9BACI|nr:hypothetical protein [Virgibacillus natechei]MBP1970785.1 hypothetical protein [Virgibacillus natechei]UZD12314.1 hypothetical protein OLD84_15520 [Virgibacillus natechei]